MAIVPRTLQVYFIGCRVLGVYDIIEHRERGHFKVRRSCDDLAVIRDQISRWPRPASQNWQQHFSPLLHRLTSKQVHSAHFARADH